MRSAEMKPCRPSPGRVPASLRIVALGLLSAAATLAFSVTGAGAAQPPVGLGTADSFAILAGSGITNAGATTITGDVGSSPTPAETGFGTVTLNGVDHAADAVTSQAKTDLTTAYNTAAGALPATAVAAELGGSTLTPGVYNSATLQITGALTLDTLGDPNAVFIFQSASTLITASASSVVVLNGDTACNVYWQVPSSATLGSDSTLIGNVLASTSISANNGATVQGRLLASTGAVTLIHNTISNQGCTTPTPTPTTTTTTPSATTVPSSGSGSGSANGSGTGTSQGGSGTAVPGDSTSLTGYPPQLAFSGTDLRYGLAGGAVLMIGMAMTGWSRRRTTHRPM